MTAPLLCVLLGTLFVARTPEPCFGQPERCLFAPSVSGSEVAARRGQAGPLTEPAKGRFLIAKRNVSDPNFAETVILLVTYGARGAMGIIINRPTEMRLASALPKIKELHGRPDRVFLGGPVAVNAMLLLIRSASRPEASESIFADVYASGSLKTLSTALAKKGKTEQLRAYAGYAGWGPGQLEHEIDRGDWLVAPPDAVAVFDMPSADVWPKLVDRYSAEWARSEEKQVAGR